MLPFPTHWTFCFNLLEEVDLWGDPVFEFLFFFLSSLGHLKLAGRTCNDAWFVVSGLVFRSAGRDAFLGCRYCCEPQPTTTSTRRSNMTYSGIMWHPYHSSLDSKLRPGSQLPPSMTPAARAIERMALSVGSRRKRPRRASWTPTSPEPLNNTPIPSDFYYRFPCSTDSEWFMD